MLCVVFHLAHSSLLCVWPADEITCSVSMSVSYRPWCCLGCAAERAAAERRMVVVVVLFNSKAIFRVPQICRLKSRGERWFVAFWNFNLAFCPASSWFIKTRSCHIKEEQGVSLTAAQRQCTQTCTCDLYPLGASGCKSHCIHALIPVHTVIYHLFYSKWIWHTLSYDVFSCVLWLIMIILIRS